MQLSSTILWAIAMVAPPPISGHGPAAEVAPPPAVDSALEPPIRRDLSVRLDLGGTEPGTARQAFEGVVAYRGLPGWELQTGWTYSDQVYYTSNRGFLTAYRFTADGMSYVKADATLRKYDYPANGALPPNPDSNSYEWVPRGELEVSRLLSPAWRVGAQYQLFPANFFWDPSSWTVNQKLSASVEFTPIASVTLAGRVALLRDPDPNTTEIRGRALPDALCAAQGLAAGCLAAQTSVHYRVTSLVGGSAAVDLRRVAVKVEYLPNRDLDNSYDWSILSTLDVRLTERLDVRLQQVHDAYSSVSRFHGQTADIAMGAMGWAVNDGLRLRGGYRYVDVPDRRSGTVIVGLELRPGWR